MTQQFYHRYIHKKINNICSYKNVYTNVYSNLIHNRQKVETTQWLSIYECMNKMFIHSEVSQLLYRVK